jgi:hypothetical protein
LDDIKFIEGDDFLTTLEGRKGTYVRSQRAVIVGQASPGSIVHELDHAILSDDPTLEEHSSRNAPSVLNELQLDEALTEHGAQVKRGEAEVEHFNLSHGSSRAPRQFFEAAIGYMQAKGANVKLSKFLYAYSAIGAEKQRLVAEINQDVSGALDMPNGLNVVLQKPYELRDDPNIFPGLTGKIREKRCFELAAMILNGQTERIRQGNATNN